MSSDWFQDDLLGVSNSGFSGGPERLEILAEVKGGIAENVSNSFPDGVDWVQDNKLQITSNKDLDNKTTEENDDLFDAWNGFPSSSNAPNLVDSSVKQSSVDWVRDNQLQTTSNKALFHKTTDAGDDSFDAWNDFPSSKNASNLANNSVKQSINQTTSVDHTSETNLFGTSNSGDLDFGSFLQPDFSAGAFNSSNSSTVVDRVQLEPSVLNRLGDASINDGKKSEDVVEGGDVSIVRAGSKSDDVERIMSQMHDLSFMLESTLSIPPKQDGVDPPSKD